MLRLVDPPVRSGFGEAEARRLIEEAVRRAIVDHSFAARLLADPTLALGDGGCSPQQHLELRGIRASSLRDFAAQAEALFWPARFSPPIGQRQQLAAVAR